MAEIQATTTTTSDFIECKGNTNIKYLSCTFTLSTFSKSYSGQVAWGCYILSQLCINSPFMLILIGFDNDSFESEVWSSQWIFQFKQLERRSLKKSGLQRDSNPWPPRCRCVALPTELWSHTLGARSICWVHISRKEIPVCGLNWKIHCDDQTSLSSITTVQNELFHLFCNDSFITIFLWLCEKWLWSGL